MKRRLAIALLLFGVVAGVLLIGVMTHEPPAIRITGVVNQPDGSVNIFFSVSNRTARPCTFLAYPQLSSNGRWILDDRAGRPIGVMGSLPAHTQGGRFVRASNHSGLRRLQIRYQAAKLPWRKKVDQFLEKIHVRRISYQDDLRDLTTDPFDIPAR